MTFRAYEDCGKYQKNIGYSKSQKEVFELAEKAQTVNTVYVTQESISYPETTFAFKNPGEDWVSRD